MPRAKKADPVGIKTQLDRDIEDLIENGGLQTGMSGVISTGLAEDNVQPDFARTEDLDDAVARISLLEKKAMIACQICAEICPQKAVTRVEKLDTESKGFTIKQSITVSMARDIQRVYGQIVALALGHEASLLYKMTRLSIGGEFPDMSRDAEAMTFIPDDSELYNEFRTMSAQMWDIMEEGDEADNIVISKKEGLIVQAKTTYNKVFHHLLDFIKNPRNKTTRQEIHTLVLDIRNGLQSLFQENTGIFRLNTWIEMSEKTSSEEFTKQTAISLIREFFPLSGEIAGAIYSAWELHKVDAEIVKGIPDWERSSIASRPQVTAATRSSPFGIVEQIKRRRDI
ncbi:unnamed protein product [Oikopleura dioica]|uniref:4Fe-4S ferredoxin-type domain-containing protein n=1 Tax=Oikopleura dioica TaxID=34765 RepID=E4WUA6_OIKDI|nr:unnamed protein product [Oikopleura dioica]